MPILYRPAQTQDLERADALVVASINNLTERHGFGAIAASHPTHFQSFSLKDDARGLWVAEEAGDILGFAWSWICGDLWFLAQLFVSPDHQGRGIGNELIKRTLHHAEQAGARSRALITFSFNTVSQGLYMRHGLFPRCPIYNVSVARNRLAGLLQGSSRLRQEPLAETAGHLHDLLRIDMQALGVSREKHHRYLLDDSATNAIALYDGDDCVGYAYIGANGHIGPLAVMRPDSLDAAFRTALGVAAAGSSSQVSAFLPGTADAVLSSAVSHGMRITLPMVLMATPELSDWSCYLPRNPGFM